MSPLYYFLLLLCVLFLLSRVLSQSLGLLIYRITKSKKLTVVILAFIFLPGTVVHEFAHAAVAGLLGVPTGDMKLLPEVEGKYIKLGSVQVGETDPIRSFLIGIAPLIIGLFVISLALAISQKIIFPQILMFYIFFQVGNGMFSSRRDLNGSLELLFAILTVGIILYFLGFGPAISKLLQYKEKLEPVFEIAIPPLRTIVIMDVIVVGVSTLLNRSPKIR